MDCGGLEEGIVDWWDKVNRVGSDGKVYVWKQQGEPVSDQTTTPTVKHGGGNNLMVWGCMGWNGVGKLIEVQGKMDAEQYYEIWRREWRRALKHWRWLWMGVTSSRTMTQNTPPKRQISGFLTTTSHSPEVACTIPWFKSNWTPLATSKDQTPTIWYTTQRSAWLVG